MKNFFAWASKDMPPALTNAAWIGVVVYVLALITTGKFPPAPILPTPTQPTPTPTPTPTQPPKPPPTPTPVADPLKATVHIRSGNAGCTATILADRPSHKAYWLLTAAHCVRGGPGSGTMTLRHGNGKTYPWKVVRVDAQADLCLAIVETEDVLPVAFLADAEPGPGVDVWHQGFGVDRPGNLETGQVTASADRNGQVEFALSVSSGDSGSGVFRKDNGRWVASVCCTSGRRMWGGGVTAMRRLLTAAATEDEPAPSDLAPYVGHGPDGTHGSAPPLAPFVPMEVIEERPTPARSKSSSAPVPVP